MGGRLSEDAPPDGGHSSCQGGLGDEAGFGNTPSMSSPSPLFRAQFVDLDNKVLHTHRRVVQRLVSAPWQSFSHDILQGLRALGVSSSAPCLGVLADAARVRSCSASAVFGSAVAEIESAQDDMQSFLDHPLRFWVGASVLRTTERVRGRVLGLLGSLEALASSSPHASFVRILRDGVDFGGIARQALRRRAARWAEE